MPPRHTTAALFLAAPGVLVLALPFASGLTPFDGLRSFGSILDVSPNAASAFLALPILAWQVRRFLSRPTTGVEIACALIIAAAAMLPVALETPFAFGQLIDGRNFLGRSPTRTALALASSWTLIGVNVLLLVRANRCMASHELAAARFLVGAYLPNAVFCLVIFPDPPFQSGAIFGAVACVAYLSTMFLQRNAS
jgi:hypothetical protein